MVNKKYILIGFSFFKFPPHICHLPQSDRTNLYLIKASSQDRYTFKASSYCPLTSTNSSPWRPPTFPCPRFSPKVFCHPVCHCMLASPDHPPQQIIHYLITCPITCYTSPLLSTIVQHSFSLSSLSSVRPPTPAADCRAIISLPLLPNPPVTL